MENEISVQRISHATLCSNTQAANSCYQLKDQALDFAFRTAIVSTVTGYSLKYSISKKINLSLSLNVQSKIYIA